MKRTTTFAAAAALAVFSAAPVVAEDAKTNADPFASSQASFAMPIGFIVGGVAAVGIVIGAATSGGKNPAPTATATATATGS